MQQTNRPNHLTVQCWYSSNRLSSLSYEMSRVQVLLQMEGKNSTHIQTPGQPDSYREMQGRIRRLLASDRCTRACLGVFILPAISWKAEAQGCCKIQKGEREC